MNALEYLETLFGDMPREFSKPQRWTVYDMKELLSCIDRYNGKARCFCSVYAYHKDCKEPVIDKVFVDIDGSIEHARKLHVWLVNKNIKHTMLFSGKGFHFYIFCNKTTDKNGLRGFQLFLEKELLINIDHQTIGDVARIATIPFTLNTRRMRYCIPLSSHELLTFKHDEISELAKKQFNAPHVYGVNLVDLSKYLDDNKFDTEFYEFSESNDFEVKGDKFLESIPKCVAFHLKKGNPNHRERGIIIMYLLESGFTKELIVSILKKYLTEEKFFHCVGKKSEFHKGKRCEDQLNYLLSKYRSGTGEWFFPSHRTLVSSGFCRFLGCKHEIYK